MRAITTIILFPVYLASAIVMLAVYMLWVILSLMKELYGCAERRFAKTWIAKNFISPNKYYNE